MSQDAGPSWRIDPTLTFLNHGSFGACPAEVDAAQQEYRHWFERDPIAFVERELPELLGLVRVELARMLGCAPQCLALIDNATTGVNTVLAGIAWQDGDELLVTDHGYGACLRAAEHLAGRGVRLRRVSLPIPIESEDALMDAVLDAVGERTRLALLDHVTSPTAVVFPVERLVPALAERGVDTLVDGAHAPGMLPLALDRLGAAFYTGNCHKWLCAPKGSAFLHVREDRREGLHPLVISHGYAHEGDAASRFRAEFDWTGTRDPSSWLATPEAMRVLAGTHPEGLAGVMRTNRELALAMRRLLETELGFRPVCPESMIGSMAALILDEGAHDEDSCRALHDTLRAGWDIEVPVIPWANPAARLVRVSAQRYNTLEDAQRLAEALRVWGGVAGLGAASLGGE